MGRFAGYIRVSRVGDRDETLISPRLQENAIRARAAGVGADVEMLPAELDMSGGDDNRPVLLAAIERIERGELDGIIVWKFDRFTRKLATSLRFLEQIEAVGGELLSASEILDASTPEGEMTRNILFSIAQGERASKALNFKRSKADAIARGIYIAPVLPVGYVKGNDRKLAIDPVAGPVVRHAFAMRAAGETYAAIATHINETLDKPFGRAGVRSMLRNVAYLGWARQGEAVNREAHPPLVDRATWEACQRFQPKPVRSKAKGEALLRGLVFCAGCSGRMTTNWKVRDGVWQYQCRVDHPAGRCPAPARIAATRFEPHVVDVVFGYLRGLRLHATATGGDVAKGIDDLAQAENELRAYQEAVKVLDVGADTFRAGMEFRVAAVNAAKSGLAAARLASPMVAGGFDLETEWDSLSTAERRQVLGGAIGAVWVGKGRGLDRVRIVEPAFRPDRPVRGGGRREVATVDIDNLEGQIGPAVSHDG